MENQEKRDWLPLYMSALAMQLTNNCWMPCRKGHQHTGRDFLRNFEATLLRQQEPLGEPFASILAEHLDELYETEDKDSNA